MYRIVPVLPKLSLPTLSLPTLSLPTLSLLTLSLLTLSLCSSSMAEPVRFNRDVRRILSDNCFKCHGMDENTREAGLRLDQAEDAQRVLDSGATAIVPGNLKASELIARITSTDPDTKMPPADSGKKLNAAEIETLSRWVAEGAKYEEHWAFAPIQRPAVPQVAGEWPQNPIDAFVLQRLDAEQLTPQTEASREALIRRVAFDLTGLPPTLPEIDKFLSDPSEHAYLNMVNQYLDTTAYGEHMARHWLDGARYADSNGFQYDTERQMWVWRDWVINAFTRNMPFDQFTIEQLAGDLLPNATPEQKLATAFNRNHPITIEGGVIDEEYRTEYVIDRLTTTATVWLGLTMGCARCHDHKFDPISQAEFYQFMAFFNQVPEKGHNGFSPMLRVASPLAAGQLQEVETELERLQSQLQSPPPDLDASLARWEASLNDRQARGWTVLKPTAFKSLHGTELTQLPDHSILAGAPNPAKETYEIRLKTSVEGITGIRLEALTHESLPENGPGRAFNSNFVLSEFEVAVASSREPASVEPVKLASVVADYSQENKHVNNTINGTVAGNNGWAVDGPTRKMPATAVFTAAQPFGSANGTEIVVRLRHETSFGQHGIGRVRLAITTDPQPSLDAETGFAEIQAILDLAVAQRSESQRQQVVDYYLANVSPERRELRTRIAGLEKQRQNLSEAFPPTMVMQDLPTTRKTFILNRGQYDQPTTEVAADVPAVFPALPEGVEHDRLALARWLIDPQHPLTARVAVNRFWQALFGLGLAKTQEDFGYQSELPSHPELLDWLAAEFIDSGWDVKHMLRLMVSSATYRQAARVSAELYERDPENRLLARGPRLRLEAEAIRDNALAVSGLLVPRVGGPSVYPYQPPGLWLEINNRPGYSRKYPQGSGDDLYRRSMYTFWKRSLPSPMLKTFDAPDREFCTVSRSRTNTPLQALFLLQAPQIVEATRHLARRMMTAGGAAPQDWIRYGFRLATSRQAEERETEILLRLYEQRLAQFTQDAAAAQRMVSVGKSARDATLDPVSHAALTEVARALFNLDEAITK